ncbi:DUF1800 domain-containing protein [Jiella endophytica]|uniref:DUF1800 domain-containing protein n=1 Tax=Jiella endophytica TaxID=2558362 RepID=A0A4Y8RJX8_9HYPH|nr:DUF1800 domain-containing protein [Jiella endophytica]TFF23294.1 DUF1800 domain-containing protein [Jiella endophytica]
MNKPSAAFAASRFGLGLRRDDADAMGRDPLAALLGDIENPKPLARGKTLKPASEILLAMREFQAARAERLAATGLSGRARKKASEAAMSSDDAGSSAMAMESRAMESQAMESGAMADGSPAKMKSGATKASMEEKKPPQGAFYRADLAAKSAQLQNAPIGYFERLVDFWSNHFAVELGKNAITLATTGAYEREAIRPHVLGRFEDMLLAVARHPAMLTYLDNRISFGVNSQLVERNSRFGLNENFGREMLELHTVGVDGGYDQDDVRALANALSGWTFGLNPRQPDKVGVFAFTERMHEPGPVTVMGKTYPQKGEDQAKAIIADLARHPATARHLSRKLVQSFVADEPQPELVEQLAKVYLASDGDLFALAKELVTAPKSWEAPRTKLRSPQEFLFASARALNVPIKAGEVRRTLTVLGQAMWRPTSPAGFPGDSRYWLAADAMTNRLDVAQYLGARSKSGDPRAVAEAMLGDLLSAPTREAIARAESPGQAYALLLMSPEFQRR